MSPAELMQKVIACGADASGIRDRFCGNAELYACCFQDFLDEQNFASLDAAVSEKDYHLAFEAAHALKGLSGNLGLTAFYEAICALVESLRAGQYGTLAAEYAEVQRQRARLAALLADEAEEPETPAPPQTAPPDSAVPSEKAFAKTRGKWQIPLLIAVILAALVLVTFLLSKISVNFNRNIVRESGQHLTEMSNQIRLYVEEQVANDWRVARSISDSLLNTGHADTDGEILRLLQSKRDVWEVSDLILYTENGFCVYSDGRADTNDVASDTVVKARQAGKYLAVIDSQIVYTIPLETARQYAGSKIVAISVVQNMETFLDDMNFSSFDEKAWMYLTEESGIIISSLSNAAAAPVFNFKSFLENKNIEPLTNGRYTDELMDVPVPAAFLLTDGAENVYVVSVPIFTGATPLRLFYLAPEAVVNRTMNGFSWQLTAFSLIMIALFAFFAFLTFLYFYRIRKRSFDQTIQARDRMFDLLIQNTRTAFGLFAVNQPKPSYISTNAASVVGDRYWVLEKDARGYRMRNDENRDTDVLRQANKMLCDWDGASVFKSGYIHNGEAVPPYYFEYALYPVNGGGTSFVGIAQDVTQAFEREEATRAAMEMANRSNEAKSRFLSNMSHDIRTPMNAIVNMTNFALESIDQPKKLGEYLHTIRESSDHLLHLINDVLDMSRIESGQTAIASESFDILAEIEKQADIIRPLCAAKKQTLIVDFSQIHTTVVCGDALKLSQIIMNLLSNAVKFTPEKGAVRFTAEEIPALSDDLVNVRFTVEDNGIGIPTETLPYIFDPFCRADDKQVAQIEGTGLGLSICKSYVGAMGGSIWCQSEEGEGTVFTVELFFQKASAAPAEEPAPVSYGETPFLGLRCLVVEDNAINQTIAKTLLERLGFLVDLANNGGDGVQKFMSASPGTYDVVYMDIQMPVKDGYQAAVEIRSSKHPQAGTIPIVAMTANVFPEDIEKARLAGMDAYLGKPVVSFQVIEQTSHAMEKRRT